MLQSFLNGDLVLLNCQLFEEETSNFQFLKHEKHTSVCLREQQDHTANKKKTNADLDSAISFENKMNLQAAHVIVAKEMFQVSFQEISLKHVILISQGVTDPACNHREILVSPLPGSSKIMKSYLTAETGRNSDREGESSCV